MNLSAMTLAELADLQRAFELIHRGTSILSGLACNQSEFETSIDMTPGELVVISTHFRMPEAMFFGPPPEFVIEGPDEVVRGPFLETATHVGEHSVTEMPEAVADAGVNSAQISDAAEAAEPGDGAGGDAPPVAGPMVKTGPLSDEEKAEIRHLDAAGMSRRAIADRLGRRLQTVALYLHGLANPQKAAGAKAEEYQAAQPAPAAEQASVADDVGADAAVEAPEAVAAAPVGEIAEGGTAEAAPEPAPVAGGADHAIPPPCDPVGARDLAPPQPAGPCGAVFPGTGSGDLRGAVGRAQGRGDCHRSGVGQQGAGGAVPAAVFPGARPEGPRQAGWPGAAGGRAAAPGQMDA